jgi:hypothetical protein
MSYYLSSIFGCYVITNSILINRMPKGWETPEWETAVSIEEQPWPVANPEKRTSPIWLGRRKGDSGDKKTETMAWIKAVGLLLTQLALWRAERMEMRTVGGVLQEGLCKPTEPRPRADEGGSRLRRWPREIGMELGSLSSSRVAKETLLPMPVLMGFSASMSMGASGEPGKG